MVKIARGCPRCPAWPRVRAARNDAADLGLHLWVVRVKPELRVCRRPLSTTPRQRKPLALHPHTVEAAFAVLTDHRQRFLQRGAGDQAAAQRLAHPAAASHEHHGLRLRHRLGIEAKAPQQYRLAGNALGRHNDNLRRVIHRLGHLWQQRRDRLDRIVHRGAGALGLRRVGSLDEQNHGIGGNELFDEFIPCRRRNDGRQKRPLGVVRLGGGKVERPGQFAVRRQQQADRHARLPLGQALGLRVLALGQVHQLEPDVGVAEQHRRRLAKLFHPGAGHLVVHKTKERVPFVAQVRKADITHRVAAGLGRHGRSQQGDKQNGETLFQPGPNDTAVPVDRKAKTPVASAAGRCRR